MPYRFNIATIDDLEPDNSDFENNEDENIDRPSWWDEKGESDYRDSVSVNCMFCHGEAFDCPCCMGNKRRKY